MNKSKYIEKQVRFAIQLNRYKRDNENNINKGFFYYINQENLRNLQKLLDILTPNEIEFLTLYFNNNLTISEKLSILNIKTRRYYYLYDKIIKKIVVEATKYDF